MVTPKVLYNKQTLKQFINNIFYCYFQAVLCLDVLCLSKYEKKKGFTTYPNIFVYKNPLTNLSD